MRILILAAMDKEMFIMKSLLEDPKIACSSTCEYFRGELDGHVVCVAKCGIGKVNAAVRAFNIIDDFRPDLVINTGVAGGATGLPVGTVVIADRVAYSDVWCGPGTEYGQADGCPVYFEPVHYMLEQHDYGPCGCVGAPVYGLVCTGDKFIDSKERIREIRERYPDVVAVDMESAAIAHVCRMRGVMFGAVRVLSDTPGVTDDNYSQYENFWESAPDVLCKVTRLIISSIL